MMETQRSERGSAFVLCVILALMTLSEGQVFYKDSPLGRRDEFRKVRIAHLQSKLKESRATDDPIRLPAALKPTHQHIKIHPIIGGNFSTYGSVSIDFDVEEETNVIQFHMLDIVTKNETIKVVNAADPNTPLEFISHAYNVSKQVYVGTLLDPLLAGNSYTISLDYEGYLNDFLEGFYRSVYQDENGQDVYLATTQMEPTQARRAFPCFDEPALKATFSVELARDSARNTISNMPLNYTYQDEIQADVFWDVYETSLRMSTYLVAFIVSDFIQVTKPTDDGRVLFGVWSRKAATNDTAYALNNGPDILSFYEKYYNIDFPLPKQDMAAIPDFFHGAMENWGLITYRETFVLYNSEESSETDKMFVDLVMAHELAHQWFGDLVTMKWWTDLWLNEGFASYMEYLGTNSVNPDYKRYDEYTITDIHPAFSIDALESSHPVSIELNDPDDIDANFGTISYAKGCSIIRMMRYYLGEDTFRQGLTNYLQNSSYANAEQDDLWAAMTDQSKVDGTLNSSLTVKQIMDTWTLQMGYPVISVVVNADGTADLTQERFLQLHDPNSTDTHDYKWWVPITWTAQDDPTYDQMGVYDWMAPTEASKSISGLSKTSSWYLFNVDQSSYYRVNYETNNWQNLMDQLNTDHSVFSILTRAQLNDDAMELARAIPGRLSYSIALEVNNYLVGEIEYVPWFSALSNFEYLEQSFTNDPAYANLADFMLDLLTPFYTYIGFDDDLNGLHLEQMSRTLVVSWMCHLNYPDCVTRADALYAQWMTTPDNNPISPNVRSSVYCTGIANGDQAEYDFAFDRYQSSNLANERDTLLYAMGCSTNTSILRAYLDETYMNPNSSVKYQDEEKVWSAVSGNDYGNAVAWDYLDTNWDAMAAYYGSYSNLAGLAAVVTVEWNTAEQLQTLQEFGVEREEDLGESILTVDQSVRNIENNIIWMDNYYDVILQWLIENGH